MESMEIKKLFKGIYNGKNVFITGHTGFKGSWLALWLMRMSANVTGFSLPPPTKPSHYELLNLNINSIIGDIRNFNDLHTAIKNAKPDIIFHLAAQTIVRESYANPVETYSTNIMGIVNLLESARRLNNIKAIVHISTDKCYENKEWFWGYRENDALGGYDPYSASKACTELITASYRNSFYPVNDFDKKHQTLIASARAGNVIGGGDWGGDRLVPDIMKMANCSQKVIIRNPHSIRPWQFVLEPLSGYLLLGQHLLEKKPEFAESWNFGPHLTESYSVIEVLKKLNAFWREIKYVIKEDKNSPHEAKMLHLDCSKAYNYLNWQPTYNCEKMFERTALWYKNFYEKNRILSIEDIDDYIHSAKQKDIIWSK